MINLNELLELPVPRREVVLRGRTVTVRALSCAEDDEVAATFPLPAVPMSTAGMGSAGTPQHNREDPDYKRRLSECMGHRLAGKVALALDLHVDGNPIGGDAAGRTEWLRKAAKAIRSSLSDLEMDTVIAATVPEPMRLEEAGKN